MSTRGLPFVAQQWRSKYQSPDTLIMIPPKRKRTSSFSSAKRMRPSMTSANVNMAAQRSMAIKRRPVSVMRGLPRSQELIRRTMRTSLKYSQVIVVPAGLVGLPGSYSFRVNGLFDPNYSGGPGGHQPRGYDQIVPVLYRNYGVMRATCKATVWAIESSVHDLFVYLGATPSGSTAYTSRSAVDESVGMKKIFVPANNANTLNKSQTMMTSWDYMTELGASNYADLQTNTNYTALYNANPTLGSLFTIFACDADKTFSSDTVNVQVDIMFDCIFFNPVDPGVS